MPVPIAVIVCEGDIETVVHISKALDSKLPVIDQYSPQQWVILFVFLGELLKAYLMVKIEFVVFMY